MVKKSIELPKHLKPENVKGDSKDELTEDLAIIEDNKIEVLSSSLGIETMLEEVITSFLFRSSEAGRLFFRNTILEAGFFTFHKKWQIANEIFTGLEENGVLTRAERKETMRQLSDVIKYRNAFAHGELRMAPDGVYLQYFRKELRKDRLDDNYWKELETIFRKAWEGIEELKRKTAGFSPEDLPQI